VVLRAESNPDIEGRTFASTSIPASQRSLELGVATIAEDATLAVLAATEVNRLGFCGLELYRREASASVAAVTEGLSLAQATGTPVVALACFNLNRIWTFLRDCWYGHLILPCLSSVIW
jgi:hypothetical protein